MKILVLGGMHGNEPLGPAIVRLLQKRPIQGVKGTIANEKAFQANKRFVQEDMNRSFPGDSRSRIYETRRPAELLKLCRDYDVVLDFHNTHCPNNDCGFVGEQARQRLYDVATKLGLRRIVVADYECVNKYAPNCLSVEISLSSPESQPELWYERIKSLTQMRTWVDRTAGLTLFRFVYRMTLDDRDRLSLSEKGFKAFKPIDPDLARQMGVKSPAYPIFVGDAYTPYNYGGLLNKQD